MSTALATRKTSALATNESTQRIQDFLAKSVGELSRACPGHLSPEKMVQVASLLVYKTPKLQECDKESILSSVIQASSLGLDLSPSMGEAWLIPRWNKNTKSNECQFQPGYQGLVKLARQSNAIDYIQARTVHAKDKFAVRYDPELTLTHEPSFGPSRGDITHVYAMVKLLTGSLLIEVMTWDEIEAVRMRSTSKDFGPWVTDWSEMAKKTVLKRMAKALPRSTELATAIELDNREYAEAIEGPKEHHAANHNNGTGHGSGAYASPDDVKAFGMWLSVFVDGANTKWLDKNTSEHGGLPEGVKELTSTFQLGGHLYKVGRDTGQFYAPDEPRGVQRDKFTAIWFKAEPGDVEEEANSYCRTLWAAARKKLKAAEALSLPAPEDESQEVPEGPPDADFDDDGAFEERLAREQELANSR